MADNKFDTTLATFVKSTKDSMEAALACAIMALTTFKEHGDLGQAQRLLEAMPKNYVRRAAFLKWMAAFSPVTMEKGKLLKDKSEGAMSTDDIDLKAATVKPFWDFAPDKEDVNWGKDDLVSQLNNLVKRYSGERYIANDNAADEALGKVKNLVANLG